MNIKHPEQKDIPLLRRLWQEAFGDSDAFLDDFFRTGFSPQRCLTLSADNALAAALYWFDCSCHGRKCAYLYAVATAKAFRGRGFCHALMTHTHTLLAARGYTMALLVPGSPSLFRMYSAMGYACFGGMDERFFAAGGEPAVIEKITAGEYVEKRRRMLPVGGVLQEGSSMEFLEAQAAFYAGQDFLLCARMEDGTLFAPELLGSADPGAILKALSCREGTFRMQGSTPFAMFRALVPCEKPTYFSFAFN